MTSLQHNLCSTVDIWLTLSLLLLASNVVYDWPLNIEGASFAAVEEKKDLLLKDFRSGKYFSLQFYKKRRTSSPSTQSPN